jgi:hypothetical protein
MFSVTCIQWDEDDIDILGKVYGHLQALSPDDTFGHMKLPEEYLKIYRGVVHGGGPIRYDRIERVLSILTIAQGKFDEQRDITFWEKEADKEGVTDLGDPENPLSAAHMAGVLAEARGVFYRETKEAIAVLDKAIEVCTTLAPVA